eukprot:TRINITY_DN50301_c0_g1_i1.p2 TRINITY_DN50301_c0_g1~~TRINITY_DN50301_c0_g1_i1.p2  ORF type:complete len:329 (+),score=95.66 TRINITY_DN50301_c0_g1_i1:94-1080(+)
MGEPAAKRPRTGTDDPGARHPPELREKYQPESYSGRGLPEGAPRGQIIDGKAIAQGIRDKIKEQVAVHVAAGKRKPQLVVVLVGDDPASKVYIRQKQKACTEVGMESQLLNLPAATSAAELLGHVTRLNEDPACDGILVQLPLPAALHDIQATVIETIKPDKDVDGFHPYNLGRLVARAPALRPCTPFGVMHLLWSTGVNPYGLRCLVVGSSNHVGRPMMLELLLNGCTVQICHRYSRDLEALVRDAECVVVACGKPGLVKGEWIRPGAVVIDIGINRVDGKLCGDVDFASAKERAGWITPVPGGVGPMTVAMLLQNTLSAYASHVSP